MHVGLHRVVHVLEPFGEERRPGRGDRPHAREVVRVGRTQSELPAGVEVLRRRPEQRHADLVDQVPEHRSLGGGRDAVEQHERRFAGEPAREPVPHHPAGRREVEDAVVGLHVAVETVLDEVLQEHAAGAVHDALRQPGRARRVEHVEGMVERERRELDRIRRTRAEPVVPRDRAVDPAQVGSVVDVPDHRDVSNGRQLARDLARAARGSRRHVRRSGSRRRPRAPSARSARTGRGRRARRSRESTTRRVAPSPAAASMRAYASGELGNQAATRSPRPTPARRSAPWIRATSS